MITRVAVNDVVCVVKSGEVGTVQGWAYHKRLKSGAVNVQISATDTRTYQPSELEFVANAKIQLTGGKLATYWVVFLATGALAAWTSLSLRSDYGLDWFWTGFVGFSVWTLWHRLGTSLLVKPRKTRVK